MLDDVKRAIFSVWTSDYIRGTAFAIGSDLLVTCEHVIRGNSKVLIVNEEPIFNGKQGTSADVVVLDEEKDLALLRPSEPSSHFLKFSSLPQLDDATTCGPNFDQCRADYTCYFGNTSQSTTGCWIDPPAPPNQIGKACTTASQCGPPPTFGFCQPQVQSDGGLTSLGTFGALPAGAVGMAAS